MKRLASCLMLVGLILCVARADAVSFTPLGDLTGGSVISRAYGVSADGSVVVGDSNSTSGTEAFRWTSGGGMVGLGDLTGGSFVSCAYGASGDGFVMVGWGISASGIEAFRRTSLLGSMVGLGDLDGGSFGSGAYGVSADGSVVVGYGSSASGYEAFRWTSGGGMVGLGDLPGGVFESWAKAVSADGSVVVGYSDSASGTEAFRWTSGGMVGLGDLDGGLFGSGASDVSADGSVVVGVGNSASGQEAFRWTSGSGMEGLGFLPGGSYSEAFGVSGDGSVVVGYGNSASGLASFLWTPVLGMVSLQDFLVDELGVSNLTGWTLSYAKGVSDSGRVIVGYGTNPSSVTEGWCVSLESLDLQWTKAASGSWDDLANWSYGFRPGAAGQDDILIQPDYGLTVTGPTSPTTVTSVTVDAQTAGTAALAIQDTGTLIVTGLTTVGPRGKLAGYGTLVATGGITNDGEIDLGDGGLQIVGGTLTNNGLIRGDGQIDNPLNNTTTGELRVQSGQRMLLTGSGNSNAGEINVSAGTVEFAKGLNNTGEINMAGGSFRVSGMGSSGNSNAGEINVGAGAVEFTRGLNNTGEISLAGGSFRADNLLNQLGGIISGRGELHIEAGDSELSNYGAMQFSGGFTDIHGNVNNQDSETDGKIIVFGGATLTFFDDLVNNGQLVMGSGCCTVVFGTMSGAGSVTGGTLYMEGEFSPGNSPAVISVAGDLVFGDASTLVIELYGTDAGEFDAVDVADTLSLDGTLDIRLMDGFTPSLGNTFDILDWSTLDGTFDEVLLPGLAAGMEWNADNLYVSGELSVITTLMIPGDANRDGQVNETDAQALATNWGQPGGWAEGDFDDDGIVGPRDASIMAANWGDHRTEAGEGTVPEPSTFVLATFGLLGLVVCSRRRKR